MRTIRKICPYRDEPFDISYSKQNWNICHFCTEECSNRHKVPDQRGEKNSQWNGGNSYKNGYNLIYKPDHPNADSRGYIFEHRLIMVECLGRYLTRDDVVHHINGNKTDNRIENLVLVRKIGIHTSLHSLLKSYEIDFMPELVDNGMAKSCTESLIAYIEITKDKEFIELFDFIEITEEEYVSITIT